MSVYFIQRGWSGPIKIGTATDPYSRLSQLQTGSPVQLRLIGIIPGGYDAEHALHEHFAASRMLGEWFQPSAALLTFIGNRFLDVPLSLDGGTSKLWRDVTSVDLHGIDETTWQLVQAGRLTMVDYDDWRTFYARIREALLGFLSIGEAVAAGAFTAEVRVAS